MDGMCSEMCDTCIFREGNKMHLSPGRVAEMVDETDRNDSNVICHKSKSVGGDIDKDLYCKGSIDRRPGQMVRIMQRLRVPEYDPNELATP